MPSSSFASRTAVLLSIISSASALGGGAYIQGGGAPGSGPYTLVDDYPPSTFFDKFSFYSDVDPTKGFVQYMNKAYSQTNGLVNTTTGRGTALMKAATTGYYPNGGLGRPSVRIESLNTYLHGLFVLDMTHMPTGCGTWPAYWLLGPTWPNTGEVDIIEGINTQQNNTQALHTSPNCTVAGDGQTGILTGNNCDTTVNGNSGCGTVFSGPSAPTNNYGAPFNQIGGGVYVTEWTSNFFKTWFFPRGSIPSSITAGAPDVNQFGTPVVNQQGSCNIDTHFANMSIIFNIDFCGNYAGQQFQYYPECPSTSSDSKTSCNNYVGLHPELMGEAYFEFNRLQVYQLPASAATLSAYSTTLSSVTTGLTSTNTVPQGMATSMSTTSSVSPSIAASSSPASRSSTVPSSSPAIAPSYPGTSSRATSSSAAVAPSYPAGGSPSSSSPAQTSTSLIYIGDTTTLYTTSSLGSTFVATSIGVGSTSTSEIVIPPNQITVSPVIEPSTSIPVSSSAQSTSWDVVPLPSYPAGDTSSTTASSAASTATASFTAGAACPTASADVCAGSSSTTCSSTSGSTYSVTCGVQYVGVVSRYISGVTLTDCQSECEDDSTCVGLNYAYTDCETFSQIYSQSPNEGSVSLTVVPADEPSCPAAWGQLYTDAAGAQYSIDCSETYDGNDLGTGAGTYELCFTDCLALCDGTAGCAGVEFDISTNICYMKTQFGTAAYTGDNRIVGRRLVTSTGTSTTTSSAGVAPSYPGQSTPSVPVTPGGSLTPSYPGGAPSVTPSVTPPGGISGTPATYPAGSTPSAPGSGPGASVPAGSPSSSQTLTVTPIPILTGPVTSGSTVYVPNPTCPVRSGTGTLTVTPTITTCKTQPVCSATGAVRTSTSSGSSPAAPSSGSSPDGVCGGSTGFNCYGAPDGTCCSQYGFCGAGDEYCGTGCQPDFGDCGQSAPVSSSSAPASSTPTPNVSPDGQCGGTSGFNCYGASSGSCCSQYGYCGADSDHCGTGCQEGFGTCGSSEVASSSSSAPASSTPTSNVSPDGQCGGTTGFNCYGASSGSCCSQYGYCGSDADHCGTGCQEGFGTCGSSTVASSSAPVAASYPAASSSAPAPASYPAASSSAPAPASYAAAPSSSVTPNVSPDGQCGGTTGFNCYGAPSGNCCSQYGYCGGDADHCGTGCQVGFGDCD